MPLPDSAGACHRPALAAATVLLLCYSSAALATGPYVSGIEKYQVTAIGNPYNTVFLNLDISDSPCGSTNQHDRFEVVNDLQHSTILSAVMANKVITIHGTGNCNSADIETVSSIRIAP